MLGLVQDYAKVKIQKVVNGSFVCQFQYKTHSHGLNVASTRDLEDPVDSPRIILRWTSALYIGYNLAGHARARALLLRLMGVVYCNVSCMAVSIEEVNDGTTFEQSALSKIHESKTL